MDLKGLIGASLGSSVASLGVATCCVLPMTMMLLGLGGSWIAIFGKIASTSYYVLAISGLVLIASWIISIRRGMPSSQKWWLGFATIVNAVAWSLVLYETQINDYLITMM